MNNINSVCVYCASSTKIAKVYFDAIEAIYHAPIWDESIRKFAAI